MQQELHVAGFLLTAAVSAAVAWWVRRRTDDRAATPMVALLGAHVVMALAAAGQLTAGGPAAARAFATVWWLFVLVNPVVWFAFAVSYAGREHWLTPTSGALLGVAVGAPSLLLLTDPLHGAFFADTVALSEPFVHYRVPTASLGAALIGATNLLVVAGFLLLFRQHLFARRASWWQTAGLLVGMVATFVPAVLAFNGAVPAPGVPYGVYGAGLFGIIVGVTLFRDATFGVAPLARDRLFSDLEDAILVVDANRRIVDFNGRAGAVFPDLPDRLAERVDDAYPALVSGADSATLDVVEGFHGPSTGPFAAAVAVPGDGERRTLRVSATEIASGGEPRGYALILRDVTELEAYAASLERKTAQLERFAGVLSHDLRNPLAVAVGRIEMERDERGSEQLSTALDALGRIEETIDDLLALSREGERIDDPERVRLRDAVAEAWATTATDDATLENAVPEGVAIRADGSRLRTMLENLFRNSVEHSSTSSRSGTDDAVEHGSTSPPSRVREDAVEADTVSVTVQMLDDGFCVDDDGPGVPEDERSQLFEYGYSSGGGTGFGLATVDAIAEAHGWTASVGDSPAGGARFAVENVKFVKR